MDVIPVQVRFDPELHQRVARVAKRMRISRNAAYQLLIEAGFNHMEQQERQDYPVVLVAG